MPRHFMPVASSVEQLLAVAFRLLESSLWQILAHFLLSSILKLVKALRIIKMIKMHCSGVRQL